MLNRIFAIHLADYGKDPGHVPYFWRLGGGPALRCILPDSGIPGQGNIRIPSLQLFWRSRMPPSQLNRKMGLRTFCRFSAHVHFVLNDIKPKVGRDVTFLGLEGTFPDPPNGILPPIVLTGGKKQRWATRIGEFLSSGRIRHKESGSLTGRLSFSQTSIFGRFGMAMTHPHVP